MDSSGDLFVTRITGNCSGDYDYATVAYSSSGMPLWTNRYNGPGNGFDVATAITVDSSGNVFVTGSSANSASVTDTDYTTIKYSNSGVPLWTNRYDGPGNARDDSYAIAVDSSGNVFVTGWSYSGSDEVTGASATTTSYPSWQDYVTIKYSNAGLPLWTNRYNGPANRRWCIPAQGRRFGPNALTGLETTKMWRAQSA